MFAFKLSFFKNAYQLPLGSLFIFIIIIIILDEFWDC